MKTALALIVLLLVGCAIVERPRETTLSEEHHEMCAPGGGCLLITKPKFLELLIRARNEALAECKEADHEPSWD